MLAPEHAKALWEGMSDPSARKVAAALKAQGIKVSWRTVARWKLADWVGPRRVIVKEPKPEKEKKDVIRVAMATPPDPEEVAAIGSEMDVLVGDIKGMSLPEIQERTRMALNTVLMRRAAARADMLVTMPKDTAAFIEALTLVSANTLLSVPEATVQPHLNGHGNGHMIDVTPANPITAAIADFKRRTGVAA
jgi:hypothetical protein